MYKVNISQFEGPMDLLVYLIEHARMSIYDIKIAEITSQYLEYAESFKADPETSREFMVLAAELIELKSRMLLPGASEPAEDDDAEDPRADLVRRILEYRQFKSAAEFLREQEEVVSHIHTKPREDISQYTENPDELLRVDSEGFAEAFRAFLHRKFKLSEIKKSAASAERRRMSLEAGIAAIIDAFKKKKKDRLMFSELTEDDPSRFGKVITFMSLLEMIKTGRAFAEQKKRFADIAVGLFGELK